MSSEIAKVPSMDPVECLKIVDLMLQDQSLTAREVSEKTGMHLRSVMAIMGNPEFATRYRKIKREVAKVEFDSVAYNRLIDIIKKPEVFDDHGKSSGDKNAISAAKTLASILGLDEKKSVVRHEFSYEEIIRESQSPAIDVTPTKDFPGFER